jgi:copper chaperone CopZ
MSIKRELNFVDGVDYIDGNVEVRTALVEYTDETALDNARTMLGEAGYAPSN